MNEADLIRMKNYEQQIDMLEKENKALRKELFKYKLKEGEPEVNETAEDILQKIRERRKQDDQMKKQINNDYGQRIWESMSSGDLWGD